LPTSSINAQLYGTVPVFQLFVAVARDEHFVTSSIRHLPLLPTTSIRAHLYGTVPVFQLYVAVATNEHFPTGQSTFPMNITLGVGFLKTSADSSVLCFVGTGIRSFTHLDLYKFNII
jgi:hypothetical protein